MGSKTLALSLLMVLGCAKGEEIAPGEVVILTVLPPSTADASVEGSSPAPEVTDEASSPAPDGTTGPAAAEVPEDMEPSDAAPPALSDSGA